MARVIAVASAKGGVGKTTTTATLGTTLAAAGARVVAVDADLGMANLGDALGVEADEATVHDVLAGRADVDAATYEGPAGLAVVPGDTDLAAFPDADPANLRDVLGEFIDYDYVLLDTGAGLSHDTVLPLGLADDVLLVTTADPSAVGDTEKTRQVAERLGGSVAGAVVTRVDFEHLADEDFAAALDAPVLATVPASPLVTAATTAGNPVSLTEPSSDVAAAYRGLARELTGESIAEPESDPDAVVDESDPGEGDEDVETAVDDDGEDEDEDMETVDGDSEVPGAVDGHEADDDGHEADDDGHEANAEADDEPDDSSVPDTEADESVTVTEEENSDDESDASAEDDAEEEVDADDEGDAETEHTPVDADGEEDDGDVAAADTEESAETDESEDDVETEAVESVETEDADGDTEDDVLVPDAEGGDPAESVEASETDADSDADDGGVYETSLVEEAEANGASADEETDETDTADDDDDEGRSGFLSRLLG